MSTEKDSRKGILTEKAAYPYGVLVSMLTLTCAAAFALLDNGAGNLATIGLAPVATVGGVLMSFIFFAITRRECLASEALQEKTARLKAAEAANARLIAAEKEAMLTAQEANRAKDEFLGIVSHELRTPLHAIAGWNRILMTPGTSPEAKGAAVRKIEKNVRVQTAIVDELLSLTDIMSGGKRSFQPLSMSEVFDSAVATAEGAARRKGIRLRVRNRLRDVTVDGDAQQLRLAFVSLLGNAIRFTEPGGIITARAKAEGQSEAVLTISDTGRGQASKHIDHTSDEFGRENKRIAAPRLGLGLAVAQRIVMMHQGTLQIRDDRPGRGTTITLRLPARRHSA